MATNNDNFEKNGSVEPKSAGSGKSKFAFYMTDEMRNAVDESYKSDNCSSRTEFVEKAVGFYLGYLSAKKNVNFLAPILSDIMTAISKNAEERVNRNLFKLAVEQGKLAHLLAAGNQINDEMLGELHRMCVEEVSRIRGTISLESAVEFQNGED